MSESFTRLRLTFVASPQPPRASLLPGTRLQEGIWPPSTTCPCRVPEGSTDPAAPIPAPHRPGLCSVPGEMEQGKPAVRSSACLGG